ncbi:hypothetical protein PVAG01_10876 [Phlyctema vagabunda]|uniref:Increased loss of mitochondrial DNA protein 1 n=1 Tax=Phlyctema vagabunda TaxID=108571 RepID=A0ABR4P3L5_9HELO
MALISASNIITSLALFHLTTASFFLTAPAMIADQTLVFIIGEAMGLPYTPAFEEKSPQLSFLAAVLLLLGITDLVAVNLPEEIGQYHWGTQAPVRLFVFFGLCFYSYAFSSSSPAYTSGHNVYVPSTWGEGLKNRVLFTWAFLELIAWFWIFVSLREERRGIAQRVAQRRAAENDRL